MVRRSLQRKINANKYTEYRRKIFDKHVEEAKLLVGTCRKCKGKKESLREMRRLGG